MSLRDTILASKRPRRPVDVPGWGVTVYARTLTPADYQDWQRKCEAKKADGQSDYAYNAALMLVVGLEEENGSPVFSEDNLIWLMNEAGHAEVYEVYLAVADLNALTKERREDIRKNSAPAANGAAGSPTNLPSVSAVST